jgi:hypothetical protein
MLCIDRDGTFQPQQVISHQGIEKYLNDYISKMSGKPSVTEAYQFPVEKNNEKLAQKVLGNLTSFIELAKNNSNTFLVFQHYERPEIESGQTKPGYQRIKVTCEKLGIIPTSLEPYFRKSIENGVNPYRDFIHPNQVGQKILAEAILAKIPHQYYQ